MSIKRTSIENLKSRVNIIDVVGKYTQLKKRGKSFVGLSPFTSEKTPSFTVDPLKNVYYCFSSNKGGDVISFVQEMEKLEFYEAVEALAERFGVPLEYEEGEKGASHLDRSLKKELLEIHLYAAEFFQKAFHFKNNPEAESIREYWTKERKFLLAVAEEFGIGYAPIDPHKLLEQLVKKNFSWEAMTHCGLYFAPRATQFSGGKPVFDGFKPRFRGRLMIPLRDVQGNVIAFTGRKLSQTPSDDPAFEAKYVNSPETPLFKKGGMLFNFDRARAAVDRQGFFLMVEGQLDTIRVSSSGYPAVIAPQGTAITSEQLTLIKRYEAKLKVFLDGDRAGQAAALRMLPMALAADLDVSFLKLPAGVDPDLFFCTGGKLESLQQLYPMQFIAQALWPQGNEASAQAKSTALQKIFEIIFAAPSAITREAFLEEVIRTLHLEPRSVRLEFDKYLRSNHGNKKNIPNKRVPLASETVNDRKNFNKNLTTAESELLLLLVHCPQLAKKIAEILESDWLDLDDSCATLINRILAEALEGSWDPPASFEAVCVGSDEVRRLLCGVLACPLPNNDAITIINNSLRAIHAKYINRCLDNFRKELGETSDVAKQAELLKKQQNFLNSNKKIPYLTNA